MAWWRTNRPAAPNAFASALLAALDQITRHPEAAPLARGARPQGTRRILLGKVRYHLYYRVSDDSSAVDVLALWHASRADPAL